MLVYFVFLVYVGLLLKVFRLFVFFYLLEGVVDGEFYDYYEFTSDFGHTGDAVFGFGFAEEEAAGKSWGNRL